MLSADFLRRLRVLEIQLAIRWFPAQGKVLEIGAGTGAQALWLHRRGYDVFAIDVSSSAYRKQRVFPVCEYDGVHIPLPDASVDVIFSSNVLEHVEDLPGLLNECSRVLKMSGYMIHIMPTPAWRWWSLVSGFADAPAALMSWSLLRENILRYVKIVAGHFIPVKHGACGTAFSELWSFNHKRWRRVFHRHGWCVVSAEPMGIFYTGWFLMGAKLSFSARRRLARAFGSACCLYVVRRRSDNEMASCKPNTQSTCQC